MMIEAKKSKRGMCALLHELSDNEDKTMAHNYMLIITASVSSEHTFLQSGITITK